MRRIITVVALGVGLAGCNIKDESFFAPEVGAPVTPVTPVDTDGPDITFEQPPSERPLNINQLTFRVTDPRGPTGAVPAGVNYASLVARANADQSTLAVTLADDRFTINATSLPDGPNTVQISVRDNAGNERQSTWTGVLDRIKPVIAERSIPAAVWESSAASRQLGYAGRISDANLGSATGTLRKPDASGACSASGALWPKGTGPGQVSENTFVYVLTSAGDFLTNVTAYNGMAAGGPALDATYCFVIEARDQAVPEPNTFLAIFKSQARWTSPPSIFSLLSAPCYRHNGPGNSEVRFTITTNSPQPGAPYQVRISGPGVVSNAQSSGMLDANGSATVKAGINAYGTYTAEIIVGDVRITATITVTSAQGTCQP